MAITRVKVPRTVLIERIQDKIDEATKEHDEDVAKYEKAIEEYVAKLPALLEAKAKEIAALTGADIREFYTESLRKNSFDNYALVSVKLPNPPSLSNRDYLVTDRRRGYSYNNFKGYIEQLEKSKRILEAATEDLISVSATDEYANYL